MSVLTILPATIVSRVAAALPGLRSCSEHHGRLDLAELKKTSIGLPGVLISTMGARERLRAAGGYVAFDLGMSAYVIARGALPQRDQEAATLCAGLMDLIPGADWALDAVGEAEDVRLHVLNTVEVRSAGMALWAVTWRQPVTFFAEAPTPAGAELHVGHAPRIGSAHEAGYEQIGETP